MPELTEEFAYIVEVSGIPKGVTPTPVGRLDTYTGHLPQALLDFWAMYGQGVMVDGQFQFCDPAQYAPIAKLVFGSDPDLPPARCHIFGFSAFGTLLVWSEDHEAVRVELVDGVASSLGLQGRLAKLSPDASIAVSLFGLQDGSNELFDEDGKPLFARARKKLGPLAPGQIYGFVPMLALGGRRKLENLKIVSALEHMSMLAQAQPIKLIDTSTMAMRVVRVLGKPRERLTFSLTPRG